jgi:DNA-binding response OmpR family regulator
MSDRDPRQPQSTRPDSIETAPEAASRQSRVLIIDDDAGLSRVVALVLQGSGFEADVATNGDEGLRLAGEHAYDAIVLDLRMPGKDGRTVYREMRRSGIETPVMILSAFDAREARDELGAQAFLNKPFEPDRLVAQVQSIILT